MVDGEQVIVATGAEESTGGDGAVIIQESTGLTREIKPNTRTPQGDGTLDPRVVREYPIIERLDRSALPEDWFSMHALVAVPTPMPQSAPPIPTYDPDVYIDVPSREPIERDLATPAGR